MKNKITILAVDPGRDKIGVAVVDGEKNVYFKEIIPSEEFETYIRKVVNKYNIDIIVIGDGTGCQQIKDILVKFLNKKISVQTVVEDFSTTEAEKRYLKENPRTGWKRLLFFADWKPEKPVDDYVAVLLAERYIDKYIST